MNMLDLRRSELGIMPLIGTTDYCGRVTRLVYSRRACSRPPTDMAFMREVVRSFSESPTVAERLRHPQNGLCVVPKTESALFKG